MLTPEIFNLTQNSVKTTTVRSGQTRPGCEKAAKILDMDGLGDRTPSQCLTVMLNLVPTGQDPGFLFQEVFLRQLPTDALCFQMVSNVQKVTIVGILVFTLVGKPFTNESGEVT